VARRRLHELDDLLDVAEQLVTGGDPAGLTLRGLATTAGVSNGTIYHAFGSKEELLARLWLRASGRLGQITRAALHEVDDDAEPACAVVAVALAPVRLARQHAASARLFFGQRSDQLFSADIPGELVTDLAEHQQRFIGVLKGLADRVWQRHDRAAVDVITSCVVDVPSGLVRRRLLAGLPLESTTEQRIGAAVRAILALPLDPLPLPRPSAPVSATSRSHR
jgi:AcrR family transcriptional regulator